MALALPATVKAQNVGGAYCPDRTFQKLAVGVSVSVEVGESVANDCIMEWIPEQRQTMEKCSDTATVKVTNSAVSLENIRANTASGFTLPALAAFNPRVVVGLFDGENDLHGAYPVLGEPRAGRAVPASTTTFYNLKANTRYAATIYVSHLPIRGQDERYRFTLARSCFETAAAN